MRFVLLEAELAEAEEHVDDLLHHLRVGLDHLEDFILQVVEPTVGLGVDGEGVGDEGERNHGMGTGEHGTHWGLRRGEWGGERGLSMVHGSGASKPSWGGRSAARRTRGPAIDSAYRSLAAPSSEE